MNPTIELLKSHRTIRQFTDAPVPDAHIQIAVEAGQQASTSSNHQAYGLLQITRPDTREALVELTGGQTKVAESGAFFVVCGDSRRHRLAVQDAGNTYEGKLEAFLVSVVDATLFAQNLAIAFESMGYGICYIGGLRNHVDRVTALLQLPEGVYPLYGLCVGVPDTDPGLKPRLPTHAVWFRDEYPDDDDVRGHMADYDATYLDYTGARGGAPKPWSPGIATSYARTARPALAENYRRLGADLD